MPNVLESPEEVLTTLTREGRRRWMYPILSLGRFHSQRRVVAWLLMALYLLLPVVHIDGRPAILLDLAHREFAIFGAEFYPTDTILLMMLALGGLFLVMAVTAFLGRVWCGWGCPQTVYLEYLFRPLERLIEGKENVRKRRDDGPFTFDKVWRKVVKLSIYAALALLLAHTFVAYFVGWSNLLLWVQRPPVENWGFFVAMAMTSGLVFYDFAYFREQMCTIVCPYARMQSVLLDRDSLIVSYDPTRGEPRAQRSKKKIRQEEAGLRDAKGDCIDCGACVRTCPTGIDIREGLQMECIACTQCIDACDPIMDKIGKPRGLIRYTSENELEGIKNRLMRPRTVIYLVLLVAFTSAFTLTLAGRSSYDINIGRVVGDPYTQLPSGEIANRLRFRVRNQTDQASSFEVKPIFPEDLQIRVVGVQPVALEPGEMKRLEAFVVLSENDFDVSHLEAVFELHFMDGTVESRSFTLLGPTN
jgi:cytochrome c oxidase accessory protein FixG